MTGCKYYCKLVSGFSNTNCKLFLGRDNMQLFKRTGRGLYSITEKAKNYVGR
jgi:hypothetical protein